MDHPRSGLPEPRHAQHCPGVHAAPDASSKVRAHGGFLRIQGAHICLPRRWSVPRHVGRLLHLLLCKYTDIALSPPDACADTVFRQLSSYGIEVVGMPFNAAITITILVNGVGVPARLIPPLFASRFGQLNTMIPIFVYLTIVSFSWIAVRTSAGTYTFAVFYGIGSSAFQCLLPSTVASITPNMNAFGTRLGMAFGAISFATLTGPSIGGAIQNAMGGKYLGAQLWSAVATLTGVAFVVTSRMVKARGKIHSKC